MSKNICLINNTLREGGIERVILTLAQTLTDLGHRVEVIVFEKVENGFPIDNYNFNIHFIDKIKLPIKYIYDKKNTGLLRDKITEIGIDFDLIISNTNSTAMLCRRLNIPNTYYCIHTALPAEISNRFNSKSGPLLYKLKQKIQRHLHSFLIKKLYQGQNLITVSNGIKQNLIKFGIQAKTIQAIYNPFDFDNIKQQSQAYQVADKDYIVHVGRFGPEKRHDILVKAYKESGIKQKLLLLGNADSKTGKKIKQLVISLDLQDKIIFKGFEPNPYPYIKNAKATILSSNYEGLPTVLIESLILGTPIVSTNCSSGPSEILIDELAPFLSPIEDINALSQNIKKMIERPIRITDKYINKFSKEESVKQHLSLCGK